MLMLLIPVPNLFSPQDVLHKVPEARRLHSLISFGHTAVVKNTTETSARTINLIESSKTRVRHASQRRPGPVPVPDEQVFLQQEGRLQLLRTGLLLFHRPPRDPTLWEVDGRVLQASVFHGQ